MEGLLQEEAAQTAREKEGPRPPCSGAESGLSLGVWRGEEERGATTDGSRTGESWSGEANFGGGRSFQPHPCFLSLPQKCLRLEGGDERELGVEPITRIQGTLVRVALSLSFCFSLSHTHIHTNILGIT